MTSNVRLLRELEVIKELKKKPRKPKYPDWKDPGKKVIRQCLWCGLRFSYTHGGDTFLDLERHVQHYHLETKKW